ncbi:MAG: hypothetical protein ACTHU0_40175 [Kofleriaceae bacterium]
MRALLFVAGLSLFGCKDSTKDLENLADRACACKDADCGKKVLAELAKFKDARGDEKRAAAAGEKLAKCVVEAGVSPEELVKALESLAE